MASSREVIMMQSDLRKHGLWNSLSNSLGAQIIITGVVVAVLIALAAKYVW
jgi:hypothetical protein